MRQPLQQILLVGVFAAVGGLVLYCSPSTTVGDAGPTVTCKDAGAGQGAGCPCVEGSKEWPATGKACYEGDPKSLKPGVACKSGKRSCTGGVQSECVGQVLPKTEVCNLEDDDCNGVIDDIASNDPVLTEFSEAGLDPPIEAGATCYTQGSAVGICAAGRNGCDMDGKPTCLPIVKLDPDGGVSPYAEVCNGLDDDCDGTLDNVSWDGEKCTVTYEDGGSPKGECKNGAHRCLAGAESCVAAPPVAETCNGKDDNCNGQFDEVVCACPCANKGEWCCVYSNQSYCAYSSPYGSPYVCYQKP
jgi:hypothetical protein